MFPEILPAPNNWVALFYFVPTAILMIGVFIRYRRYRHLTGDTAARARSGTLWLFAIAMFSFSIVGSLIQWNFR